MSDEDEISEGAETDAEGGDEGEGYDAQRALIAQSLEVSKLKQHIEVLKRANERIREQYKQEVRTLLQPLIEKHRKLQADNGKLQEKLEKYAVAPPGTDEAIVEELRKLRHDHAILQKISEGLEADSRLARRLQAELEEALSQISTLDVKVADLEREKRRLEAMVADRDQDKVNLEDALEKSRAEASDWREKFEKAQQDHNAERKEYQQQLGEAVGRLHVLERNAKFSAEVPEVLPAIFEELQAELATYDELASLFASSEPLPESIAASLAHEPVLASMHGDDFGSHGAVATLEPPQAELGWEGHEAASPTYELPTTDDDLSLDDLYVAEPTSQAAFNEALVDDLTLEDLPLEEVPQAYGAPATEAFSFGEMATEELTLEDLPLGEHELSWEQPQVGLDAALTLGEGADSPLMHDLSDWQAEPVAAAPADWQAAQAIPGTTETWELPTEPQATSWDLDAEPAQAHAAELSLEQPHAGLDAALALGEGAESPLLHDLSDWQTEQPVAHEEPAWHAEQPVTHGEPAWHAEQPVAHTEPAMPQQVPADAPAWLTNPEQAVEQAAYDWVSHDKPSEAPSWLANPEKAVEQAAYDWVSHDKPTEAPTWLANPEKAVEQAAYDWVSHDKPAEQAPPSWMSEGSAAGQDFSSQLAQSLSAHGEEAVEVEWEGAPEMVAGVEFAPGALEPTAGHGEQGSWAEAMSAHVGSPTQPAPRKFDDDDMIERLAYGAADDDAPSFRMQAPKLEPPHH